MNTRTIEAIIAPPPAHFVGDGFRMHNFIPHVTGLSMKRMDPFLVLDYGSKYYFPPSKTRRGVGVHPHKGFETVTIAYHGSVAHNDSTGSGGVINEGDVQWMTAGNGILHKEYQSESFSQIGGDFQVVQLWVNLPAKDKSAEPKYQNITKEKIAQHTLKDNQGVIEVIAGEYQGTKGPASTFTLVHLSNAKLKKGGKATYSFPAHYTTAMIVIEGSVKLNGKNNVPVNHFVLFGKDGQEFTIEGIEDAVVLVLSGEPINEHIAAHGPFVMNTQDELMQAFYDFNIGKFGYLE